MGVSNGIWDDTSDITYSAKREEKHIHGKQVVPKVDTRIQERVKMVPFIIRETQRDVVNKKENQVVL